MKKKSSIRRKFLFGIIGFVIVMMVGVSLFICQRIYHTQMEQAASVSFSYSRMAADLIDGDKTMEYFETEVKDEYYDQIQDILNATQKESDLKYYYVFVPLEDDLVYIWDADNYPGSCELGQHENYMEGGKEAVEEIWCQNPPENIKVTKTKKYGFIASAFTPIYNSKGDPVAVAAVDLSMHGLYERIFWFIEHMLIIIGLITLVAIILLYHTINRSLVQPIHKLTVSAGEIVNNLEKQERVELDIKTGDELETLAEAFTKMDLDLRSYITEVSEMTAEREKLSAELNVATNIQAAMLPHKFPERDDFVIYASMDPAKEVGGDFYDFFMIDDDHLAMVMADVSGKGVPAALFMVIAKTLIKNIAKTGVGPAEVLSRVNKQLCESNDEEMFVTVWLGILELSTGRGISANAGHEHPAFKKAGGQYELVIYKHSPAVAIMEGLSFNEREFEMKPGDTLFVYTDGVPEASDKDNVLFGTDRMIEVLNVAPEATPEHVLCSMRTALDDFVGQAPQFDDITMLCLQYNGKK